MTTFALLAGAGGDASHLYSRVVPLLRAGNHEALAIDLPADDEAAGLPAYADIVVQALAGRTDVVLVAHSLSGFTAPLVMERTPLRALVFLNAMVPRPGERAAEWWDNTGVSAAREAQADRGGYPREVDLETYFTHDVDPAIAAEGAATRTQRDAGRVRVRLRLRRLA
ncbi:alpha/beta fold hydrolase [Nocardioides nematodiphilus]|uniref:alpha/beta fold hydrolase n=1 Tax=Nocardioides nematodiphilus TaxID=2849669 RepID=UPI001CDA0165|nr:alpha/beta hydrolase [Nocardioides nematodiphilus]MCA1984667.1 alpha/beta fold hydrolase [Nocardioides nematodiphilus]